MDIKEEVTIRSDDSESEAMVRLNERVVKKETESQARPGRSRFNSKGTSYTVVACSQMQNYQPQSVGATDGERRTSLQPIPEPIELKFRF